MSKEDKVNVREQTILLYLVEEAVLAWNLLLVVELFRVNLLLGEQGIDSSACAMGEAASRGQCIVKVTHTHQCGLFTWSVVHVKNKAYLTTNIDFL